MELGGRCPCGAVMGELGQNKQPTTHQEKYRNTNTKYRNTNTQYRNTNTKYIVTGKLRETINDLLEFLLTACGEQNVSNITIILFHVRKSLCVH